MNNLIIESITRENERLKTENTELLNALHGIMQMVKVEGIRGTSSAWYSFGEHTAAVARAVIAKHENNERK